MRAGFTVSSFSDKCNPKLLTNSTSCNQMSPSSKLALYFVMFSERRTQKSGFVLAAVSSGFFYPRGGNLLVVLFGSKPKKKMCDANGDGF